MATPLILLAGYLGSGKTTLLLHLLSQTDRKIAVLMNEFGELGIDTQTVKGKHVAVRELLEGCVCCSLVGEFHAAVEEILKEYCPDLLLVETTGIAEADNLVLDIDEELTDLVCLQSVITVIDAEVMVRFPHLRGNTLSQIEAASVLLINKKDLVSEEELGKIKDILHKANSQARIITTSYGKVCLEELIEKKLTKKRLSLKPDHTKGMESVTLKIPHLTKKSFEIFLKKLPSSIERAKGYIRLEGKDYLVNYVRGRYSFDEAQESNNKLVVIGKDLQKGTLEILLHEAFEL